jgi:hypothetical protein
MSLVALVNHFAEFHEVPIEVSPDVRNVMVDVLRVQDEIVFCKEDMSPDE